MRGTVNVVTSGEVQRVYVPIQDTATNPAYLEQVMARAEHNLITWLNTYRFYRHIPEFAEKFEPFFMLIESTFPSPSGDEPQP